MTKSETIQTMLDGAYVRHKYFDPHEHVKMPDPYTIEDEAGHRCTPEEFWKYRAHSCFETDWEIVKQRGITITTKTIV